MVNQVSRPVGFGFGAFRAASCGTGDSGNHDEYFHLPPTARLPKSGEGSYKLGTVVAFFETPQYEIGWPDVPSTFGVTDHCSLTGTLAAQVP
jgi:hypothetical protein